MALALLSTVVTPQLSLAANGTWIVDADGNWSDAANWSGGAIADGIGATANFNTVNLTGNRSIALFAPRTLGILNLGDTNHTNTYTIGGAALIFDNGGSNAQINQTVGSAGDFISSALQLKSSLDISNASTSTLSLLGISSTATSGVQVLSFLSGNTYVGNRIEDGITGGKIALVKSGAGTLILDDFNTYTGGTTITQGTLQLGNGGSFGSIVGDILNNGNLAIRRDSTSFSLSGAISGTGAFTIITGSGQLSGSQGNTYSGLTTITGGGTLRLNKSSGNAIAGDSNTATNDVTVSDGQVQWLASNQVGDTATITLLGGRANLNGNTDTFYSLISNGGLGPSSSGGFTSGVGTHLTLTGNMSWLGGTNTIDTGAVVDTPRMIVNGGLVGGNVYNGANVVSAGGVLQIDSGGAGLEMSGGLLTLSGDSTSPGKLLLLGNVTTFDAISSSSISSAGSGVPGTVDLGGGTRTFTTASGAGHLFVDALITNGAILKDGAGILSLSGNNTYNNTTLHAGTIDIQSATAIGTGSFTIDAPNTSIDDTGFGGAITLANNNPFSLSGGDLTFIGNRNLNLGTGNFTLSNASRTITVQNSGIALTIGGIIQAEDASLGITKAGLGQLILSGVNTYTGATNVNGGKLALTVDNSVATSSGVSVTPGAVFDIGGSVTQNIGPLSGAGTVNLGGATLKANNDHGGPATSTFDGVIAGASGNLVKVGTGTLTLSGANTYSGVTTINSGTLKLDSAGSTAARLANTTSVVVNGGGTLLLANSTATSSNDRINNAARMTLNGGTFNTGGLSERNLSGATITPGIGALTLQNSSIIDLANGASILAFANSSAETWNGTLSIYNWSGIPVTGNGTDQLFFGTDVTGLTLAQLNSVSFYSDAGSTFLGSAVFATGFNGEIVPNGIAPVPEPSTWVMAGLACSTIAFSQRRRFTRQRAQRSRSI